MNVHLIPADAPLTVQKGQCRECGERGLYRLLVNVGKERAWVLATLVPEGYLIHDCKPDLPKAA